MNRLADDFFTAVSRGDTDTLERLYASDAMIWHDDDGQEQTVAENLRVLRWLAHTLEDMRYEDIRRQELPAGFTQMHVLRGVLPGHGLLEVPATLIVRVEGGLIARIEEYTDPAHTAPLLKKSRTRGRNRL